MRTVIIGQAPSKETVGKKPFSGKSGPRLADLLGVPHSELWDLFDVVNVVEYYPGPGTQHDGTKRGDFFPLIAAKERARRMVGALDGRTVLLIGRNVARAFELADLPFFEWRAVDLFQTRVKLAIVPHPSGVNHFWNEPENVETARMFMRSVPR